jgi:GAF domain-containing protein
MSTSLQMTVEGGVLIQWQHIADIVGISAALVMQVLVSSNSEGNPYKPGESEHLEDSGLYCETVVKTQEKLLVPDALTYPHWETNPDVKLNMISYLGYPISYQDKIPFAVSSHEPISR